MSEYKVVWPKGKKVFSDEDTVDRIGDLSGKTVAAIWDYLFRGDEILAIVTKKLSERFTGMKFVSYDVFGNNHGSKQHELLAQVPDKLRLHKVDAVISLVGA